MTTDAPDGAAEAAQRRLRDLRREAAALFAAARDGDAAAHNRAQAVLGGRLADRAAALEVVAVEAGHKSWAQLACAVRASARTPSQRLRWLGQAIDRGHVWAARILLAVDPSLRRADIGLCAALLDVDGVASALAEDPAAARREVRGRTPLAHLAFSRWDQTASDSSDRAVGVAAALLAHGADANDAFRPDPAAPSGLSVLYGALSHGRRPALARWLLSQGADPNDGESLYHATELGETSGLQLLLAAGARPNGTNALPRALDFDDLDAARLLLAHGADPDAAAEGAAAQAGRDTIPALHQAARRRCGRAIAEALLTAGADPHRLWRGRSAYARARIYGADGVAAAIEARGVPPALSDLEAALAACAQGRAPAAPIDPAALGDEDRHLLTRLVWTDAPADHVEALIRAGFDADAPDEMGMTPLHLAAWEGRRDRVEALLAHKPDLSRRNGYGGDVLDTVVHGAAHCLGEGRDHLGCAARLLAAGARPSETTSAGCGDEALIALLDSRLADAPEDAAAEDRG